MAGADLSAEVSTDEVTIPVEGERSSPSWLMTWVLAFDCVTLRSAELRPSWFLLAPLSLISAVQPRRRLCLNGSVDQATADGAVAFIRGCWLRFHSSAFASATNSRSRTGSRNLQDEVRSPRHPTCQSKTTSAKIDITSQNHGFALAMPTDSPGEEFSTDFG